MFRGFLRFFGADYTQTCLYCFAPNLLRLIIIWLLDYINILFSQLLSELLSDPFSNDLNSRFILSDVLENEGDILNLCYDIFENDIALP